MADNKVVLEFELQGNATEKTQSLRAQMKALREELARLPEGTAEFNKVQRELGALTDKVGDLSRGVNTLAGDPLERLNNSFGMIGNSLMSLDFGGAITGIQGMSSAIGDLKWSDIKAGIDGMATAFVNLGKSLLTNPIFLIAAAIAAVGVALYEYGQTLPYVSKETRELAETTKKAYQESEKALKVFDLEERKLRALGVAEKDLMELRKKKIAQTMQTAKDELKAQLKVLEEQEASVKASSGRQAKYILGGQALIGMAIEKAGEAFGFIASKEKVDEQKKNIDELKNKILEYEVQILELNKKESDLSKKQETNVKEKIKTQEKERESAVGSIKEIQERGAIRLETERRTGLDLSKMSEDLAKSRAAMELAIEEKKRQTILEGEVALKNARLQIASQTIGGLMDLASAMSDFGLINAKKSFQINKALGIAQATIQTYEGATAAFTTASKSPISIAFPGYPALMAGIAVTAGLAKIAKISATKFNPGSTTPPSLSGGGGGGGGMGSGGSGGSTSAPALDLSFLNNKKTGAQPIQSYVLATNVTSAQDAQQKIIDQSKLIK